MSGLKEMFSQGVERVKNGLKQGIRGYEQFFELSLQLQVINDVLEYFWKLQAGGALSIDSESLNLFALYSWMPNLPSDFTHLQVHGMLVPRNPNAVIPEEERIIWGLQELETKARELAKLLHIPRTVSYEIDAHGGITRSYRI